MKSITWAVLLSLAVPGLARAEDRVDYPRQIKPIFAQNCYKCHGPSEQESDLRLDTAAGALTGGNSGPAVLPGKPDESLLILAITGTGDASPMPPEGERLTAEQVALIRAWIAQGAKAPQDEKPLATNEEKKLHWAFEPIVRPDVPSLRRDGLVRNPIDAFIQARLERAGIQPSPEADRTTLIRRLSFDLLGLPPSVEEVDQFLADTRPNAYELFVDRLLASPHYGERWGRHWLDLARYADSNGYTIDGSRSIWKYRDWVIDALNRDLPFNQFTIEQIAGDMLPEATLEQRIATGFHRNTLRNEEGGTDQEQFRVEAVVDRVDTTGSVFLGLSLGCARCHDHKYDPVSQREFYQMFALFNNTDEPTLTIPTKQKSKELPALEAEIADAEKRLAETEAALGPKQAAWEKRVSQHLDIEWAVLEPVELKSAKGATLARLDDGSILVGGQPAADESYTFVADSHVGGITAVRLEALTHESLPKGGPGLASNGNLILSELKLAVVPRERQELPIAVAFSRAAADHSQAKYPVSAAIDGKRNTGWAINGAADGLNVDRTAYFVLAQSCGDESGARLSFTLEHHSPKPYLVGRFRLSVTTAPAEAVGLPDNVRLALAIAPPQRTPEQAALVKAEYFKIDPDRIPIAARVDELKARYKQLSDRITTSLVMQERAEPRVTNIHLRGDFLRHGAKVEPAVPAILPALKSSADGTPSRLDLARWLVDERNPLTPRVTVNRIWQHYFGQGIVVTENDFGTQGTPPTHPELLDWLAAEFRDSGWRLKNLHRLIVTSATYRQSSQARPDLADKDPTNKLLARQLRMRLDAEVVRDAALAAGGLLSREIGGPGVYPPQAEGIYRFTQTVKFWAESKGEDRYRRGLYTYFWRSSPYPFLITFDAPNANVTCTRRVRSNTPLQALTLANDRSFFEFAQALAVHTLADVPGADEDRLRYAFRRCMAREPSVRELVRLIDYLHQQRQQFSDFPSDAEFVAPPSIPAEVSLTEAAAWTSVARVLMNLDEFITRE